ncbi:MAG: methionine gamma-lyase family protein [Oscillospiraceae bacterium]|nr:methionine gamma-lyase family protein [Oscillospiraceae bacterium]
MNFFDLDDDIKRLSEMAMLKIKPQFEFLEKITEHNQLKVLAAFIENGVSESHFAESTGYGYGDRGREALDRVFARSVGAEAALVRHSFACGTHTLTVALFGLLRPGDVMLSVTGTPYDTIRPSIGISGTKGRGSLMDFGVEYRQVELAKDGGVDFDGIENTLKKTRVRLVYVQRSRGYALRPSLSAETIGEIAKLVKKHSDAITMVDNCYGEFVQKCEPTDFGADLVAGSLIKNPGGGLAKNGGYIAGRGDLVELCACRMTTPGLGAEVGATLGQTRSMLMGLFNAPHVTGEALKTAVFAAALFEEMGYEVTPRWSEPRFDIIQALMLRGEKPLVAFCRGIQSGAPVDAFAVPEPWDMPGYDSKVIMAAGAFILGSSIELSADAPLREPYAVWMQGGLNFHSAKMGVMLAAQRVLQTK